MTTDALKKVYNSAGGSVGLAFGTFEFVSNIREGDSIPKAAVKTVATNVAFDLLPGPVKAAYIAGSIGKGVNDAVVATFKGVQSNLRGAAQPFSTNMNPYLYNGAPATIRQRYLQAMQDNKINVRSALGREAEYLHR